MAAQNSGSFRRASDWVTQQLNQRLQVSTRGLTDVAVSALPQVVGLFTGFATSVLMARGLGPTLVGQFALVTSLAGIATTLSELGINQTAIRFAARAHSAGDRDGQMAVLRWALRWRLAMLMVATATCFALAPWLARTVWHNAELSSDARLALAAGVFATLAAIPTIYFQSIQDFARNAWVGSAQKVISVLGVASLAVLSAWSLRNMILVTLGASALGAIAFVVMVPKAALWARPSAALVQGSGIRRFFASPTVRDPLSSLDASTPAHFAFFSMLATVVVAVTMQLDVWMMGYYLDKAELGIYSLANRFTLPLTIVLAAINTALWPRAASATTAAQVVTLLKRTFRLCALVSLAMVCYSLLAPQLAPWLFGAEYAAGKTVGVVLCLRYCIALLICPIGAVGYSFGLVRYYWISNVVQLVVVACANVLLLPRIGSLGCAIALVLNDLVGGVITGVLIMRRVKALPATD